MKDLKLEKGSLVCYLNKRDVEILRTIQEYVSPSIFEEDSILKGKYNSKGYYKITSPENVEYLKKIRFIPKYNILASLDTYSLSVLEEQVSKNAQKLINLGRYHKDVDLDFLNSIRIVDENLAVRLKEAKTDEERKRIIYALTQQIRCYNYSVREMLYTKQVAARKAKEKEKEEKKFSFNKILKRIRNK